MDKKILAIIPARGGSKRIPRKNIKPFCGKPLIGWSIDASFSSGVVDRVIVSTDDEEIARIAKDLGAEVPFIRPDELAEDTTPTLPVLQHAVEYLRTEEEYVPDYILLLEPTSPLRQSFHLKEAVELLKTSNADSVIALGEVPRHFSPSWQFSRDEEGAISLCTGADIKNIISRGQDLPVTYFRNGVFYLFKTELLFSEEPSLYGNDVRGYVIDNAYSVDIDTPEDWVEAEEKCASLSDTK